jgi:uncharacterized surface protein with fasciclin (FAS1) repeats
MKSIIYPSTVKYFDDAALRPRRVRHVTPGKNDRTNNCQCVRSIEQPSGRTLEVQTDDDGSMYVGE